MKNFDLHVHSDYSDGLMTIGQIIALCQQRKIASVAITDHDTVDQVLPAQKIGRRAGVRVLAGAEISVSHKGQRWHLLAYHFNPRHRALRAELSVQQEARRERLEKLKKIALDLGFLLNGQALGRHRSVSRIHLARLLWQDPTNYNLCCQFGLKGPGQILEKIFSRPPAVADRYRTDMKKAIDLVHAAGGLAVLAHPIASSHNNFALLEKMARSAGRLELDGLEVFSGRQKLIPTLSLYNLAKQYGLLITAGSDFHGTNRQRYSQLGQWQEAKLDWTPEGYLF